MRWQRQVLPERTQVTRELVVSLNHKRRIFRRVRPASPADRSPRFASIVPPSGVLLAAVGGVATLLVAAWLFVRPSNAPAHAPASQRFSVTVDHIAVIDGDTLKIGDQVIRLQGIVAPSRGSSCRTASGAASDCGAAAANALAALVRDAPVDCTVQGHDAAGRAVAACRSAGVTLSEALVQSGWARVQAADPDADLRRSEDAARAAGRGIWRNPGAS